MIHGTARPFQVISDNPVTKAILPQYQQSKRHTRQKNITPPSFAERWQTILALQPTQQIITKATQALKKSGTFLTAQALAKLSEQMLAKNILRPRKNSGRQHIVLKDQNNHYYAIHRGRRIAKGSCSKVRLAQQLTSKAFCAVKISADSEEKTLAESSILQKLGLLEGLQFHTDRKGTVKSYLFMKWIRGITLKNFIKLCNEHSQTLSLSEQAQILLSMLEAMQQLVILRINHGDIHDRNVMFDPITMKTHLIDFGDATELAENDTNNHQHYDIRKLVHCLKPIINHPTLTRITSQHLAGWTALEENLQNALDAIRNIAYPVDSENKPLSSPRK